MRNKRIHKYMGMAAVFAVCSAMISCSTAKELSLSESSEVIPQTALTEDTAEEKSYKSVTKKLPAEMTYLVQMKESPTGGAYICGIDAEKNKLIYRISEDYSEITPVQLRGYAESDSLYIAPSDDGGVYAIIISVTYEGLPEPDFDDPDIDWYAYEEAAVYSAAIDYYDASGAFVSTVEVTELPEGFMTSSSFVYGFEMTNAGSFIICSGNTVAEAGKDGKILRTVELPDGNTMVSGLDRDGRLVCVSGASNETVLYTISTESMTIENSENIGSNVWVSSVAPGIDKYRLILTVTDGVYGLKDDGQKLYKLVDNVNTGLQNEGVNQIISLENGEFAAAGNVSGSDRSVPQLSIISERSEDAVQNTQTITMAMLGPDPKEYLNDVNNFNSIYDGQYRIEIVDDYVAVEKDFSASLNEAIITGDVPDIVCVFDYSVIQSLAGKNALADLYPLIDSDPELSREMFMQNVLEANEFDGRLAVLPCGFNISTMAAKDKFLGGAGENWTPAEMISAVENLPDGVNTSMEASSPYDFLYSMLFHSVGSYVDYDNAECSFDSEEFVTLLELCMDCPKCEPINDADKSGDELIAYYEERENAYKNDQSFMTRFGFGSYKEYVDGLETVFGSDPVTLVGYPTTDGSGSRLSFSGMDNFVIMEGSENKDAAWAFIRQYYLEDVAQDLNGSAFGKFSTVEKYNDFVTDDFESYVKSITKVNSYDYDIFDICMEEAEYYFNGERTAQEAADIIQNRVSILVSEQS